MTALSSVVLAIGLLLLPNRARARSRVARLSGQPSAAHMASTDHGQASQGQERTMTLVLSVCAGLLTAIVTPGAAALPVALLAGGVVWPAHRFMVRNLPRHLPRYLSRLVGRSEQTGAAEQLNIAASWDLLAAGLRAGLPVSAAMLSVTEGLPTEVAEAVRSTADLIALGADPYTAWEPALACRQTAELARAARRTTASGTALASVATEHAAQVRAQVSDNAEAHAQRAGVLIAGPLGLCFLPAFFCVGVAPVILGLADRLVVMQ